MSKEQIASCPLCQLTFSNHEELFVHSCEQIKVETYEFEDKKHSAFFEQSNEDVEKPTLNKKPKRKLVMCRICNKPFEGNYKSKRHEKVHIKKGQMIPPDEVFEPHTNTETPELKTKVEIQEVEDFKVEEHYDLEYSDLDLSEEFLSAILKQVDELCDAIKNGDPNLEQTTIVNQNLNSAVSVYRDKLFLFDTKFEETTDNNRDYCDDFPIDSDKESLENDSDTENEPVIKKMKSSKSTDNDYNPVPKKRGKYNKDKDKNENSKDNEIRNVQLLPYLKYKDKNKVVEGSLCNETFSKKDEFFKHLRSMHTSEIMEKLDNSKPKKKFRRSDEHISEMIELVKSQYGNHSVPSMARTLKMPKCTIFNKIKQQSIVFSKHEGDCHFCKMMKNVVENDKSNKPVIDSSTFLCLRYNKEEKLLYCSICKKSASGTHDGRTALLRHIINNHQKAIEMEKNNMKKKNDCENHVCRETYGLGQQQL